MRPKRTDDKYSIGTRDFNHIRYERDLEDYIIDLENETQQLRKHSVSQQHELLLDFLAEVNGNLTTHPHLQMSTRFVDDYLKSNISSFCECRTKKPMARCMDDRTYCADCRNVIKQYDR